MEDESKHLENLYASEDAKQKIAVIVASILRKNLPLSQNFEKEKKQLATIKHNLTLTKTRLNFVSNYSSKKNYFYRINDFANLSQKILEDKNSIVSLIADALIELKIQKC